MNKKNIVALSKRWTKMLLGNNVVAVDQKEGSQYSKDEILGYYNDLTGKVSDKALLDQDGIPMNEIPGGKLVYFPISIFQYALGLWDMLLSSRTPSMESHFMKLAQWIVDNQLEDGSWDCFSPLGYHQYTASAMGQGEAISVLLRAYQVDNNQKWTDSVHRAFEFMTLPLEAGGVLHNTSSGPVFEEYAAEDSSKPGVLNGWIFSLFGIYDYYLYSGDCVVKEMFQSSVHCLAQNLSEYDNGYWSYYDQSGKLASPAYHKLHIALLRTLADISGVDILLEYSDRWQQYLQSSSCRNKAILVKVFQKLREKPEGIVLR